MPPKAPKIVQAPYQSRSFIEDLGDERTNLHRNHNSTTDYTKDGLGDRRGVLGEYAFELLTGFPMDRSPKPKGDDYDFFINGWYIDVKATSYDPPRLYVKQKRIHEHYLYVVGYADLNTLTVKFYGWAQGNYILENGIYDTTHYQPSYYIQAYQAFGMNTLPDVLKVPFII